MNDPITLAWLPSLLFTVAVLVLTGVLVRRPRRRRQHPRQTVAEIQPIGGTRR